MDTKPEVKFGEWIQKGFDLYKENLSVLLLSSLIAVALSFVTLGILSGPLMAGMILIVFRLLDGSEPIPQPGDVFKGFDCFLQTFLFGFIWGVVTIAGTLLLNLIPCLGQLLAPIFGIVLQTAIMFGLILIVDRNLDFWTASRTSFEKVRANFFPFLGLSVVASLIGSIGGILCGIGVFLTLPIYVAILVVAYREVFAEGVIVDEVPTDEAPPQPPESDETDEKPIQE